MAAAITVLAKTAPKPSIDRLRSLFSIPRWRFGNLESSSAQADSLGLHDRAGWTPLYWAARCGNAVATRVLLSSGADINKPTTGKRTPLMASVMSRTLTECFQILLSHGANPHYKDAMGRGALHLACENGHLQAVKSLIEAGVPVDSQGEPCRYTGLTNSGTTDAEDVASFLLREGANINHVTTLGFTALTNATARNSHACTRLFLERGANYLHVPRYDGSTLLHYAAAGGDLETMDILAAHGLRGLDVSLKNNAGMTALQCFHSRSDVSPEPRDGFARLLDAVCGGKDDDEDEDVFFDALESQDLTARGGG